jgi:hypothetical protein
MMSNETKASIFVGVLAAVLASGFLWWKSQKAPASAEVVAPGPVTTPVLPGAAPQAEAAAIAAIRHPFDTAPPAAPLPALDDSDRPLTEALVGLLGEKPWQALFYPDRIVRRIVATIDNLPRQDAPVNMWPVKPVGAWMMTAGAGDALHIAPDNARRYAAYAALVKAVNAALLVDIYRRFYPLFQQAYVELGYPQGYFNDRLVAAIDDLLAAPELAEPPRLVQRKVIYQFADPDLERRSAGQKILLRIGADHARIVKARLREIRSMVARP